MKGRRGRFGFGALAILPLVLAGSCRTDPPPELFDAAAANSVRFPANSVRFPADSVRFPADSVRFPADSVRFPADWVGRWQGTLEIFRAQGRTQTVGMELHVEALPGGAFRWRIRYGDGGPGQDRDYRLRVTDAAARQFVIDEQNGIELPGALLGGTMVQRFRVRGRDLLTTYHCDGEVLRFTAVAGSAEGQPAGQGVTAFPSATRQEAVLRRAPAGRR